jgi:hypothetical protein
VAGGQVVGGGDAGDAGATDDDVGGVRDHGDVLTQRR